MCVYIYIYIYRERERDVSDTANLRTKILNFGGFNSSIILISRGGIPMSIGIFPETLSQRILVGIINRSREVGRNYSADRHGCTLETQTV